MDTTVNTRPMTLKEYCNKLPQDHSIRMEYAALNDCREHPLKWWWFDIKRHHLPFLRCNIQY